MTYIEADTHLAHGGCYISKDRLDLTNLDLDVLRLCRRVSDEYRPQFEVVKLKLGEPELTKYDPNPLTTEIEITIWQNWTEGQWDVYIIFEEFVTERGIQSAQPSEIANWLSSFLEETLEKRRAELKDHK